MYRFQYRRPICSSLRISVASATLKYPKTVRKYRSRTAHRHWSTARQSKTTSISLPCPPASSRNTKTPYHQHCVYVQVKSLANRKQATNWGKPSLSIHPPSTPFASLDSDQPHEGDSLATMRLASSSATNSRPCKDRGARTGSGLPSRNGPTSA